MLRSALEKSGLLGFQGLRDPEKLKLSFRAEAYNITNTANFALPNAAITSWTVSR